MTVETIAEIVGTEWHGDSLLIAVDTKSGGHRVIEIKPGDPVDRAEALAEAVATRLANHG